MSNKVKVKYGNTELFSIDYPYNALDIKYKNNIISTIYPEETVGLNTKEKLCDGNFNIAGYTLNTNGTKCTENIFVSNELPYEELLYIESTGTLYINTGLPMSSVITLVNGYYLRTDIVAGNILFGSYDGSYVYYINHTEPDSAAENCDIGPLSSYTHILFPLALSTVITRLLLKNNSSDGLYFSLNDTSASGTYVSSTGSSSYNHFLFAHNNQGTAGYYYKCKLFNFTIFVNNSIVRDFIPVKRKSDNVVCLYDTITNQYFENQGTGEFIAGPVVLYSKLEYIESTGTLYIDTGLKFPYGFGCKSTFLYPETTSFIGPVCAHTASPPYYRTGLRVDDAMNFLLCVCEDSTLSPTATATINTLYKVLFSNISASGNIPYCIINDINQTLSTSPSTDLRANINLYLFALNQEDLYMCRSLRLYNIDFYNDANCTELVKSFIPVKRSGSNEYGLLDKVSHVFYRNLGTGSFIPGPPAATEFTLLLYIQSTGTLWVDTGYIFTSSLPIDAEFKADTDDSTGVNLPIAGCSDSGWNGPIMLNFCNNAMEFGTNGYTAAGTYAAGTFYKYKAHIDSSRQSFSLNDTVFLNATNTYITSTTSLSLFTHKISTGPNNQFFKGKLSYFRLSISGILTRNFIPVRRNSDNVVCLYDTITNQYFENAGTGEFIGGPEV